MRELHRSLVLADTMMSLVSKAIVALCFCLIGCMNSGGGTGEAGSSGGKGGRAGTGSGGVGGLEGEAGASAAGGTGGKSGTVDAATDGSAGTGSVIVAPMADGGAGVSAPDGTDGAAGSVGSTEADGGPAGAPGAMGTDDAAVVPTDAAVGDARGDLLQKLEIGPAGGAVTSADGKLTITVPSGALSSPIEITIALAVAPPLGFVGAAYDIGPSGTTFQTLATLSFAYDLAFGDSSVLSVGSVNSSGEWAPLPTSFANSTALQALTPHLSTYALMTNPRFGANHVVTEFAIPTAGSGPGRIASGPDRNVWFTECQGNKIGRITPAGTITEFPVPTANSCPLGIAAGSDGAMWFTESTAPLLTFGRITTAGSLTEFPQSSPEGHKLFEIVAGPDGSLWFSARGGAAEPDLWNVTTSGDVENLVRQPASSAWGGNGGLAIGRDDTIWVTGANQSTTISISSIPDLLAIPYNPNESNIPLRKLVAQVPEGIVSDYNLPAADGVNIGLTLGPDGNMWFTSHDSTGLGGVGRVTSGGVFTLFDVPGSAPSDPAGICALPGNYLWFTEHLGGHMGQISTTGVITQFALPPSSSTIFSCYPYAITAGPDGNLWFTEGNNKIGRFAP